MKHLVGFALPSFCENPLQTGPLAQGLDIEVWVPIVDHPDLKMRASVVKVRKLL